MSILTPACTPAARPDPVPRVASPAGAGLWIAPAVWKTRTIRSRLNAPASRRVSHTALDGTERRPHAPQARSLYSSNTTSRVELVHPLRIRWEETDRPTSLRSDERSRSPESVFTIPGFGVQLHRNAHNRAGQETGLLFEPIITAAIGGVPASAKRSPIKRRKDDKKGRQVDCLREKRAYEITLRMTVAAAGQGRWGEELDFPKDRVHLLFGKSGFLHGSLCFPRVRGSGFFGPR